MAKRRNSDNNYNGHMSVTNIQTPEYKKTKILVLNSLEKFQKFHTNICSEEQLQRKTLKKILNVLRENQENIEFRTQAGSMCNLMFVAGLLWRYNCTLSGEDLLIYDILEHLEKYLFLDFRIVSPLVFGQRSRAYYNELIKYGRSLHKCLHPDQVLEYFDQKRLWDTLIKMTSFDKKTFELRTREFDPNCYDPRFVLQTLVHLVQPGTKLNCKNIVTSNALSFCFASTSFYDSNLRAIAYAFLEKFRRRLFELTEEHFPQRIIYRHILDMFKNSIEYLNQRINHSISQFLARITKLALAPEDPNYPPLMTFFTQKPWIQLDTVPEFYKLFFSTSTEFHIKERQWMLRLISNSIVDSQDYGIICKVFTIEYCMNLFTTPLADYWSKLLILRIFRTCLELDSATKDMFLRLDFDTWLAMAISHKRTTIMEQFELALLYKCLTQRVEKLFTTTPDIKLANIALRRPFLKAKLTLNLSKIVRQLRYDSRIAIEKDAVRRDELIDQLHKIDWL